MSSQDSKALKELGRSLARQYKHDPRVYFIDFFLSLFVGYFFAYQYLIFQGPLLILILLLLVAGFILFRVGLFMHEIVHMKKGKMRLFKLTWNVLFGVPLASHHYLYTCHLYHHHSSVFGTQHDGEYLPLARGSRWQIVFYLLEIPIIPLLGLVRFLLVVPLSWLFPNVRLWMIENASSAVMNPKFKLKKTDLYEPLWALCDACSSIIVWSVLILSVYGFIDLNTIVRGYFLLTVIIGINWVRNLVAHSYSNDGVSMSHFEQYLDSINIKGPSAIVFLFFPIGMRYHALHHLFPSLPYHSLGRAHRQLMSVLPAESVYLRNDKGFFEALWNLLVSRDLIDADAR